jgi:OHCU decarboxylase
LKQGLDTLNSLAPGDAVAEFLKCCGSARWAERMAAERPFEVVAELLESTDRIWWELEPQDWLEAFNHHPKIGEKRAAAAQSTDAARWSEQEQSGTRGTGEELMAELGALNRAYEERFGFIFIVCAAGKTTEEMIALLRERLHNDTDAELRVAAEEQRRITHLRLRKLLEQ